ncbi:MAG: DUF86 domain-containing protein [Nanoarchaeota archaeon]
MKRDYKLYLQDIKKSINQIESYLKGISQVEFNKNLMLQDAVIRRLEIIGEASKNIPGSLKEKNRHVPWIRMQNYRDFIIHSYFEASLSRIWVVATKEIKEIKEAMKNIILV